MCRQRGCVVLLNVLTPF
jgi:hypothetical protein